MEWVDLASLTMEMQVEGQREGLEVLEQGDKIDEAGARLGSLTRA